MLHRLLGRPASWLVDSAAAPSQPDSFAESVNPNVFCIAPLLTHAPTLFFQPLPLTVLAAYPLTSLPSYSLTLLLSYILTLLTLETSYLVIFFFLPSTLCVLHNPQCYAFAFITSYLLIPLSSYPRSLLRRHPLTLHSCLLNQFELPRI